MTIESGSMAALDPADLDANDVLAFHRERYIIPHGVIYLDGNSLGPARLSCATRLL